MAVGIILAVYYSFVDIRKTNNSIFVPYLLGSTLFIFITSLLSTRPISYYFGDMGNYNKRFIEYTYSLPANYKTDILFDLLMRLFAKYSNAQLFFFTCSLLYFLPLYLAYRRIFNNYWTVAFTLSTLVITFYGFAVNGIRNGIAAHILLLAVTMQQRKLFWLLSLISIGFHSSMIVPLIALLIARKHSNTNLKPYYYIWLGAIIISLIFPNITTTLQSIIPNDKFSDYVDLQQSGELVHQFSKTGYRYDLILYGAIPVMISAYYNLKRNMEDSFYNLISKVYILCNAFFITINQITFPNRFAYLSWFIMIPVLFYPIYKLKKPIDNLVLVVIFIFLILTNMLVNG